MKLQKHLFKKKRYRNIYLNKMLVLSFSQPPKVRKIQLSRAPALRMDIQVSCGDVFRKSRFPFPWVHRSSHWCGQCKIVIPSPFGTGRKLELGR